jgi:2,6-dihydroxypseudooxynicotine hydrolase
MADSRLETAVAHWGPRFAAAGVYPADFARITSALDSWDEWCGAWCQAADQHAQLGEQALAQGRTRSAGAHLAQAAVYYHFAKFLFVHDRRQLRAAHPAVVLIPGLDSAKEEFGAVEQSFLDRGLATLSVDGPGQGEAEYELTIRPDWEVPGAAILDALAAQPGIDGTRIGVWGVSLGGYYAPRVAAGDARVRACIALCGPYCLGDLWPRLPGLTRDAFTVRSGATSEQDAIERARQLTLAGRTGALTMPLLIVAGRRDRIFPWQDAVRLRDSVPGPAELLLLDDGNHGCANVPYRHRPYSADWMARQLTR